MVAAAGATPCPQITSGRPRRTSKTRTGTSPPGPLRCGSTTCSVNAVATAASKALPPFSSVAIPTPVAIQWVEVTTPKVPSISGRVVNGLGLMLDMMGKNDQISPSRATPAKPPIRRFTMLMIGVAFHIVAAVIWVGGMFFALVVLRASTGPLDPPTRLALWQRVFGRFFPWVWGAVAVLLVS